ncbi:MAG TPA: formimidoylglutamate deiminase [Acetobacteraceae bacterium]|nr:formimidoylglutamate deiminase [Acetobacteraceae bacterium]
MTPLDAIVGGATSYLADAVLIGGEVVERVRIDIGSDGRIAALHHNAERADEHLPGLVLPGLPNLHSHAFQRAMAGLAERAGPEGDNFWRWREVMYRFLAALTPEDVQAIAAQTYAEGLLQGYTSVAEFHYLHNAPDGSPYAGPAEMSLRIVAAAEAAGVGLTLLPVLYRQGGFGAAPPTEGQRRFVLGFDAYERLCREMAKFTRLGIAPHSLRAVAPDDLARAVALADAFGKATPIHIHVAEQTREVEDCLGWSGARPVAWLLDHAPVDARWCLVHATHIDAAERVRLAGSGAVAGLCQTTEANLGDGIFPLRPYLAEGGRFGIGTDSNVSASPVEELRWMEYVRRLEGRARNVSESRQGASVAATLLRHAAEGGAQALGRDAGEIAVGRMADLIVLDPDHPSLVGRRGLGLLDAFVFSGNATPVRHVMVGGAWVVRYGAHLRGREIEAAFARTMRRLAEML